MSSSRNKLRQQILRLEQGFPQNWIYIERKVKNPLRESNPEGVKASQNYIGKTISDIIHNDLINIYNQKVAKIRPIVGANGAGKTTLLEFQVKENLENLAPNANLFLFFDFKAVTDNIDEFWPIFVQNLISQLVPEEGENKIRGLIQKIDVSGRTMELFKIFKNQALVNNLMKLNSMETKDNIAALEYFYGDTLETKTISDLFYGILRLALKLDYLIAIAFDEIQFLNEIDTSNVLLKLFLEKFVRYLMEQFSNEKLYVLISCLENPEIMEWTNLKGRSKNFETIVRNKEIVLGNLTPNEKDEIIQQVADKIGFERQDQNRFFSKVKSSIQYYLPRDLLKCIANVIDSMDYIGYTDNDIRQIYEENARAYMREILKEKGFIHLEPSVKEVGGYNVDIYATAPTNRAGYVNKALGEATMMQKKRMKQKIEKFANWLYRMKDREFNPEKGDFAFIICPPNSITSSSKEVLDGNNIELFEYSSPNIEQLIIQKKDIEEGLVEASMDADSEVASKDKGTIVFKKESKYKLIDVPGIGPAKEKKLIAAGIHTIKDLLNCNVKMKAKEIYHVGEVSLNKWRQAARQVINN